MTVNYNIVLKCIAVFFFSFVQHYIMFQGGSGLVNDITFQDINFTTVKNPIIVDQYYHARLANEYSRLDGVSY